MSGLEGLPERSYDEILAAGRTPEPDDDDFPVSWGGLFAVLLIFGGLVLLAVLMANAARDEPVPVTGGGGHAVVSAAPQPPRFGPGGEVPPAFHESGTGSRSFQAHPPEAGILLLYVKVDTGRLTLSGVDEHDIRKYNLAIVDGPYEGVEVLWGGTKLERLRVEATGTWTVELRSVRSLPVKQPPYTGTATHDVFWYDGPAGIALLTYSGERGALRVDTFDEHIGAGDRVGRVLRRAEPERARWPKGPVLVEVDADGPWGVIITPI